MRRTYEVAGRTDKRAMREFLKREGQLLLPMVELVERAEPSLPTYMRHGAPKELE